MDILSARPSECNTPGIDADGVPTMSVAGYEIALLSYWKVVALSDSGRSPSEIVDHLMKMTEVPSNSRSIIVLIVDAIVENLHLVQGSGFNPEDSRRMSRASVIFNNNKPMRFSSFRPSMLSAKPDSSQSWEQLQAAQQKEGEIVTEALKLLAQKETVRKAMPESAAKRMTEAQIDGSVRDTLRKHEAVEAEVRQAKKLVKRNRMTMA